MNANPQSISAMSAITISREYASGGGEIAARLVSRLGWQLIDHAVIEQTAGQLEVRETEVEKHDEDYIESDRQGILSRLLEQLTPSAAATGGGGIFLHTTSSAETLPFHETMRDIIIAAATSGHVVIVGRGGQVLLADRRCAACSVDRPTGATRCLYCSPRRNGHGNRPQESSSERSGPHTLHEEQLGPIADLAPYPGKPIDFRVQGKSSS